MVRKKKITVSTDNSDWKAPKKRKPRKPMSDEQKAAASERLAKARAVRAEKNPDYGQSSLPICLKDLPEDHPRHPKKVKVWIKTQKDLASSARSAVKQNIKGSVAQLASHEGYIRNMQRYLRDGDWVDDFYGEHQQNKIRYRCIAMAFHDDGTPKRNMGVYYPDLGCEYTKEMFNEERGISNVGPEKRKRKGKRKHNTGPVAKVKKKG